MPTSKGLIKRDSTYISLNMTPEALVKAMRVHGLTATKVIKPIALALEATKVISAVSAGDANGATTDFIDVPDHPTRLKAAAMAIELLGLKKAPKTLENSPNDSKELTKALKGMDEVELQRAVFRKQDTDTVDKSHPKRQI